MKKVILCSLLVIVSFSSFAIDAKYRHKLEQSGCTQVDEASGKCNLKTPKVSDITQEADHVMNKPVSESAEYLLSKGWKPNNGVWKKKAYILTLIVENEKVVNVQLKK